jgi:peptide/nickel transport system substrate-binding protein
VDLFKRKIKNSKHSVGFFQRIKTVCVYIWSKLFKRSLIKKIGINDQIDFDKKLVYSLSRSRIPSFKQLSYLTKFLSAKELLIFRLAWLIIIINLAYLGTNFYFQHLQISPLSGGEYKEAIIGSPKYVNPLYASVNDVDSDLCSLVYSSLFKRDKNGKLINDLAANYEIAEGGKNFIIEMRKDAKWHNGDALNAEDLMFTFGAIKAKEFKSPLRLSFNGVEIEKIDDYKVKFVLTQPYAAFLELLTFGILPQGVWSAISPDTALLAEINLKPIGSGPYQVSSLVKDKSGNIRSYSLKANENYYGQKPYITDLSFVFYTSYEEAIQALNNNEVNGISYLPREYKDDLISQNSLIFHRIDIPQITAIFFNQNENPALEAKGVRQALNLAVAADELIQKLGSEYYEPAYGPIYKNSFAYKTDLKKYNINLVQASKLLVSAGWTTATVTPEDVAKAEKDKASKVQTVKSKAEKIISMGVGNWLSSKGKYLTIKLTTIDRPENFHVVEHLKSQWEKLGVKTNIDLVPITQIKADVIDPRSFEALVYGLTLSPDPDPYVFWHSSQIEKGLNISGFNDKTADKLMERARQTMDEAKRKEMYYKFQDIIAEEVPAIFLYESKYTYIQEKKVKGFEINQIYYPYNRFDNVIEWYVKTGQKLK